MRDLLVVGAGPAGVSAALWGRSLDLDVTLIDADERAGGQLHRVYFHPRNVAGFTEGDGAELANRYAAQLAAASVPTEFGVLAAGIEPPRSENQPVIVHRGDGGVLEARAVVIATGLRRRRLDVPGEGKFEERGVYASATRNLDSLAKQTVLVIGGGDGGHENALILHDAGCRVTLLVRGHAHARAGFRRRVADAGIDVMDQTTVLEILGDDAVRGARVERLGQTLEVEASAIVVKVGNLPNTEWCAQSVALDDEGYILVDATLATSASRVWAAGDVIRPAVPAVPAAAGHGALAAAAVHAALGRP